MQQAEALAVPKGSPILNQKILGRAHSLESRGTSSLEVDYKSYHRRPSTNAP